MSVASRSERARHIDLFYHLTDFFDVKCYLQNETIRDSGNLTWEKLVEETKHQECVGKEYAKFRRENGGGGTPSYGDPALAADAVSRGVQESPAEIMDTIWRQRTRQEPEAV